MPAAQLRIASWSRPASPITTRRVPRGASPKRLVEVVIHAGADGLHGQAHGLAGDRAKALEAQDVVGADDVGDLR